MGPRHYDPAPWPSLPPLLVGSTGSSTFAAQAGVRHSIDHPHNYVQANLVGFTSILDRQHQ